MQNSQEKQAYRILHLAYTVAPLVAGVDKFTQRLSDWDHYVAPQIPRALHMTPRRFMQLVGAVEVVAGVGVAAKPGIFGYVVSGWLMGIIGNLTLKRDYYDIALRDLGLALGALSLARLSAARAQIEREERELIAPPVETGKRRAA